MKGTEPEVLVDFICQNPDMRMLRQYGGQGGDLILRVDCPGRVGCVLSISHRVWGVIAASSCSGLQFEALLHWAGQNYRRSPCHADNIGIAGPIGRSMMTSSPWFRLANIAFAITCFAPVDTMTCVISTPA